MKIEELVQLGSHKLMRLNGQRATAEAEGDLTAIGEIDLLIAETEQTLAKLRTLE